MRKNYSLFLLLLGGSAFGQSMKYTANLEDCKKDKISVDLTCSYQGYDTAFFSFPMTIPGTYAVLDYGRYISQFKAFSSKGTALKVVKRGNNTFAILPGKDVASIRYTVDDSWDEKTKKNKIFEPAGTGFEAGKYFYINAGGLFGFFGTEWKNSIEVTFKKPSDLNGYTSLKEVSNSSNEQRFMAKNYHDLIDNPILFTAEKDQSLTVQDTKVSVASYYEASDSSAYLIREKIDSAMMAIDQYAGGKLPVSNYTFLNYIKDYRELGPILQSLASGKQPGIFQILKVYKSLAGQGFGALEHGNSSSYFLPDFGANGYTDMLYETAIHEFMHIYTPLNLHSQYIGEFNYVKPVMSKHLWLYEGVTEYSSVLIAMQGKLTTVEKTIEQNLKGKIIGSYSYPDSIPFTTMSANVFDKPYIDYYPQVYERGAIMAMLLDIEIMRLTKGSKTLKSVIFQLSEKYGANQSFNEETFINEFISMVHPDLKRFFELYVTGTTPLAIEEGFSVIGIDYKKEKHGIVPVSLIANEEKAKPKMIAVSGGDEIIVIKKKDKLNFDGFMAGDKVNLSEMKKSFMKDDGTYVAEGTMLSINVERKGKTVAVAFPAKFKDGIERNVIGVNPNMTTEQTQLFKLWSTGKK